MVSHRLMVLAALTLLGAACANPLEGRWEGADSGQRDNEVEFNDELEGRGSLSYTLEGVPSCTQYDVKVTSEDGDDYGIDWECTGNCNGDEFPCGDFDFDMDCVIGDDDTMECDGDGLFRNYGSFEWEKK